MFWGLSEARDLVDDYSSVLKKHPEELNILFYGMGDPCHLLKTIAKMYRNEVLDLKINFYLVEGCAELISRDLLLMTIPFEDDSLMSIGAKTAMYMDIFGNTLLRSSSSQYLSSKSEELIKYLTDADYNASHAKLFNFDNLKYKDRDQIELAFKFWKNKENHVFDIQKYWESQLRAQLKDRYDHRKGAFDWDLQMKLRSYGAKQICVQEYTHWRESGIAFTFPEFEYCHPNKTFAMDIRQNGSKFFHRGYVGDMNVGPFISFGIQCCDESLLKSNFGSNQYRSTDVTERNVFEIIYEINNKETFDKTKVKKNFRQYGSVRLQEGKTLEYNADLAEPSCKMKYNNPLKVPENVTITFLSIDSIIDLHKDHRFEKKFDIVFVASNYLSFLKHDFSNILNNEALVLFETRKYSIMQIEKINQSIDQIKEYCSSADLKPVTPSSINVINSVMKYKHQKQ